MEGPVSLPRREDAVVLGQRQRGRLVLLRLPGLRGRHHVRAGGRAPGLPGGRRMAGGPGGRHPALLRPQRGRRPQARTRLLEIMGRAVAWYHERLLSAPTPARRRSYLQRGLDGDVVRGVPARLGSRRLGTRCAGHSALDEQNARDTGLGRINQRGRLQDHFPGPLLFPIHDAEGRPVSFGGASCRGPRRPANQGKYKNTTETPLTARAASSTGSTGPSPRSSGTDRGRHPRGLHRRDRVPASGRAPGRRHVRHRPHRRTRGTAAPLRRPPAGAGVRRRRCRPGRRRALLPVGAQARPRGGGGRPARRPGSGRRGPVRPRPACAAVDKATPFLRFRLDRVFAAPTSPATRAGQGAGAGAGPPWPSIRPISCATSTDGRRPGAGSSRTGCGPTSRSAGGRVPRPAGARATGAAHGRREEAR